MFDGKFARAFIHWVARLLSIISTWVLLLFLFGGGESFEPSKLTGRELLGLLFFPCGVVLGFGIAWWKEGLGGGISILSLLAFYLIFGWLMSGEFVGWWFLVFAIPGPLFLASYALTRRQANQLAKHHFAGA